MPKYTHLSQRDQILKRPAQHIGSTKTAIKKVWVAEKQGKSDALKGQSDALQGKSDATRIVEKELSYNAGLIHIFYEVLSNAQDNYFISKDTETPLKKIEITVSIETGTITVWNDGQWIPNRFHKWEHDEEKIDADDHYEAEIIFGYLNSSSNYDEKKARIGAGLHGVGVKLTNIFSSQFEVICFDPDTGLKFKQSYSDNMRTAGTPKISSLKQKRGYT